METKFLLLSIGTATFGFIIWYALSASLRLPKSFQIQYDINIPFINRVYRRRILLFILYALIPYLLIVKWGILGDVNLNDLEINFAWNSRATMWIAIGIPFTILYNLIYSKRDSNLIEYPEIRVTMWTTKILIMSGITQALQAFAMEFLFRGLLLQSLLEYGLSDLFSGLISTGIYAVTLLYLKNSRIFITGILFSLLACYIVIYTNSLLPVIIIHLSHVLINEWLSVRKHPEINII